MRYLLILPFSLSVSKIDWAIWIPRERANLCFIRRDCEVLLIRKKRGLGAGKMNAPGGKIDPGESAVDAAIRETHEEVGVVPIAPQKRGELHFQFADGYSLWCSVFLAEGCEGEPHETAEATPIWTSVDEIPYSEMWADDAHWLPLLLAGERFRGYFEFDGDLMLSRQIETVADFADE